MTVRIVVQRAFKEGTVMSEEWFRTNWFRVLDIDKFDSNGMFSDLCNVSKDDEGYVSLSSSGEADCFLISGYELSPVSRTMMLDSGAAPEKIDEIRPLEGLSSYDPKTGIFENIWGLEILNTFLPPGEVVIVAMVYPGFGKGFAWREGMSEGDVLTVDIFDIFRLAEKEFGRPEREQFGW